MPSLTTRTVAALAVLLAVAGLRAQAPLKPPPLDIRAMRLQIYDAYDLRRRELMTAAARGEISAEEAQRLINVANEERFTSARKAGEKIEEIVKSIEAEALQIREDQLAAYIKRNGVAPKGDRARVIKEVTNPSNPNGPKERISIEERRLTVPTENTGTALSHPDSRGVFGDLDKTAALESDRAAFVQAAKNHGYTEFSGTIDEGFVKIEGLDAVIHGPSDVPRSPLDRAARLARSNRALGHESFAAAGSRQPYLKEGIEEWASRDALGAVADNIKKVEKELRASASDIQGLKGLKLEEWSQNLAKGAGRAMDAAGKTPEALKAARDAAVAAGDSVRAARLSEDLSLREQLNTLKTRMDPVAAGLVPPTADEGGAARILQSFQDRCLQQFGEAYRQGVSRNAQLIEDLNGEILRLLREGATGRASILMRERATIIDGAAEAVHYLASAKDGGKLLAEVARGERLTAATRLGRSGYTNAAGEFISEAEVKAVGESVLNDARARLGRPAPGASGGLGALEKGMLGVGAILSGYFGAQKELEDARREGREPSNLLAVLKGWWEMTGAPGAFAVGHEASRQSLQEEIERIQDAVRRGENPNVYMERLWTITKSLVRAAGGISGVTFVGEKLGEFPAALLTQLENFINPPPDLSAAIRAKGPQLASALARDLSSLQQLMPQFDAASLRARSALAAITKSLSAIDKVHGDAQKLQGSASEIERMCTANVTRVNQIAALRTQTMSTYAQAAASAAETNRLSEPVCTALAASGAKLPTGFAQAGNAHDRMNRLDESARDAHHRALDLMDEFDKDAGRVDRRKQTDIGGTLKAMPDTIEDFRASLEEAVDPVDMLRALSSIMEEQAAALIKQANLLIDAKVEEDTAFTVIAGAERVQEKIKTAGVDDLVKRVQSLGERYVAELEYMGDEDKTTKNTWASVCPNAPPPQSFADIDALASRVGDAINTALQTYARAHDCVVNAEQHTVSPSGGTAAARAAAEAAARTKADADRAKIAGQRASLNARIAEWQKGLACLEEAKRKTSMWVDCNGNFTLGSRDNAIEDLKRLIREAQANLAKLSAPAAPAAAAAADAKRAPASDAAAATANRAAGPLETSVNRAGGDYREFKLPVASAALCQQACLADSRCKAFTFVAPMNGASAMCRLKDAVPSAVADACCTSGIVQPSLPR